MKHLFIWSCLLVFNFPVFAQPEIPQLLGEYTREDAKNYCWVLNDYDPDMTYPEDWKDQSAICLRQEQRYYLYDEYNENTVVSFLSHSRFKLQDEAAIEDFSEIYYKDIECSNYYTTCFNVVGIRIIKANGSIIEVNDAEIITMDDNRNKVAVPNLEIGDVLDYYVYRHINYPDHILGKYSEFERYLIDSEYPIVDFKYSIVTNENWKILYSSGEFHVPFNQTIIEVEEDPKGNSDSGSHRRRKNSSSSSKRTRKRSYYQYEIAKTNLEPVKATRWNYYPRTGPYVKLFVHYEDKFMTGVADTVGQWWSTKVKNQPLKGYYDWLNRATSYNNGYGQFKRYMKKKYGRKIEIPDSQWAEEWFYFVRYYFTNRHYIADRKSGEHGDGAESYRILKKEQFMRYMVYGLSKRNMRYDFVFIENRDEGRLQDLILLAELDQMMRIHCEDGKKMYVARPSPYTHFNSLPAMAESTEGYAMYKDVANYSTKVSSSGTDVEKVTFPESSHMENLFINRSKVILDSEDPTLLHTDNEFIITGHQRYTYKYTIVDWVDMIKKEHVLYGDSKLLKDSEKEEYSEFFKGEAKDREERITRFASDHFDVEEEDVVVTDYKVISSGNTVDEDSLHFTIKNDLKGLVKKVGPNYLLQLGKLASGQLSLDEDELERDVDVYMPYARGFKYEILVQIPEGYEVKGLDKFNNDIDNETGTLYTQATLEGNNIKLTFYKYYKHNFEPKANWSMMVDFLQPGAAINEKDVLLKKKRG